MISILPETYVAVVYNLWSIMSIHGEQDQAHERILCYTLRCMLPYLCDIKLAEAVRSGHGSWWALYIQTITRMTKYIISPLRCIRAIFTRYQVHWTKNYYIIIKQGCSPSPPRHSRQSIGCHSNNALGQDQWRHAPIGGWTVVVSDTAMCCATQPTWRVGVEWPAGPRLHRLHR